MCRPRSRSRSLRAVVAAAALATTAALAACDDAVTLPTAPTLSPRGGPLVVADTTSGPLPIDACPPPLSALDLAGFRARALRACWTLDDAAPVGPADDWPASGCTCAPR